MANLRDIRKRISSVQSTKQITRTMEMVATAKVRHSFERIATANPYASSMRETLANVAQNTAGTDDPLLSRHDELKRIIVIVVTSDRGMAGGFNSNVLREAERIIKLKSDEGAKADVVACGKKAAAFLRYRKMTPLLTYLGLSSDPTFAQAQEIASLVMSEYRAEKADEITLVYNHARNSADQDLRSELVLPIDPKTFKALDAMDSEEERSLTSAYSFEPSAEEVLSHLLPAYVEMSVFHALIDSAAGEQGARRKAMKAATDNATDMLDTLDRVYNQLRQSAITTEISEIVGGAAALED
jgi:F-type H+-transporting ATPase subunit gamma